MDEKTVKNLSWKDGFVSSIDGVATNGSTETFVRDQQYCGIQQGSFQNNYANPILEIPITIPDIEEIPTNSNYRRFSIESQPYENVSYNQICTTDIYHRKNDNHQSHNENEYHYEKVLQNKEGQPSGNKKINNYARSKEISIRYETEKEVPSFAEEFFRRRQRSQHLTHAYGGRVNNKRKIYVLVNRNDGVITHVIKESSKY